jgi:peroxiredoxin
MKSRFLMLLALFAVTAAGAWARNAVDFTLPDSTGKQVSLSSYRGKYVVLEFLLVTCSHCQAAGQVLEKLQAEYGGQLQVLGIAIPAPPPTHTLQDLANYKSNFHVTYPILQGTAKQIMDYLGFNPSQNFHIPAFFVIGPTGEILQDKNPDRPSDAAFYNNPNPAANPLEPPDVWLTKNLDALIRQTVPKKAAGSPAGAARKPAAKKTGAPKP